MTTYPDKTPHHVLRSVCIMMMGLPANVKWRVMCAKAHNHLQMVSDDLNIAAADLWLCRLVPGL